MSPLASKRRRVWFRAPHGCRSPIKEGDADLGQYLPPPTDPNRTTILVELVKTDQENAWNVGRRCLLEEYLDRWPELRGSMELVADLLDAEGRTRAACGDLFTAEELHGRFPEAAAHVDIEAILGETARESLPEPGQVPRDRSQPSDTTQPQDQKFSEGAPKLQPGDRLGQYEIQRELSRGGMATVYLARHVSYWMQASCMTPCRWPSDR